MSEIRVGDRVKFRAGRGYALGRVANIAEGMATIATDAGKNVNRKLRQLELLDPALNQALDAYEKSRVDDFPTRSAEAV